MGTGDPRTWLDRLIGLALTVLVVAVAERVRGPAPAPFRVDGSVPGAGRRSGAGQPHGGLAERQGGEDTEDEQEHLAPTPRSSHVTHHRGTGSEF